MLYRSMFLLPILQLAQIVLHALVQLMKNRELIPMEGVNKGLVRPGGAKTRQSPNRQIKHVEVPWYFRCARASYAMLAGSRGEYFVYRMLKRAGLLDRTGRFPFYGGHINIPLGIPETLFIHDFSLFHGLREINFANAIHRTLGPQSTLVDCGAAFGQVSCRLSRLCPNISDLVVIEPNPEHHDVLKKNLSMLHDQRVRLVKAGVGSITGRGELQFPNGRADSHSAYVKSSTAGNVELTTIDDLLPEFAGDLAMKIDVEGGELDVLEGAEKAIKNARNLCLFIEIHPKVLKRTSQTAEQILQKVSSLRPVTWSIADAPLTVIDPDRSFFSQVPERIYDVIGISSG